MEAALLSCTTADENAAYVQELLRVNDPEFWLALEVAVDALSRGLQ